MKMKEYPNFYENWKEAHARLYRTIVLYDGLPYQIVAITDHMSDNIFRAWLDPLGVPSNEGLKMLRNTAASFGADHPMLGKEMDGLLEKYPNCGVLRKHLNSPLFNRFRPFPLGMCNVGTQCYYIERRPIRPAMHQGLTQSALYETLITAGSRQDNPKRSLERTDLNSPGFRDCILGDHYPARQVLAALLDTRVAHDALAFHREFALVRGPIDMIFLAYRSDIIGVLPKNNFDFIKLGRDFKYCREVVAELGLFHRII